AAIDSLVDEEALDFERPRRPGTDGSFTPAPSRRTSQSHTIEQEESGILIAPAPARRSGQQPYAVAPREWRYDETSPPVPPTVEPGARAAAARPIRPSRLPWIIALISISAAAATGVMLYLKLSEKKAKEPASAETTTISMTPTPTPTPTPSEAPADAAGAAEEEETGSGSGSGSIVTRLDVPDEEDAKDAKAEKRKKRREREREREKTEKAEKTVAKAETPSAGPPGFITIDSTPVYAVIFINGKKYGETPLVNIKLPPGRHAVRAVSPSGSTRNLSISIEPGKTAPVKRIEW
ncbi:MAG: PEGA domain-containing protein, partial [Kofleriaceae bacterium]|nr:PEGA domain-containing protein [Kofleriaceae bacterium]